MYRINQDPYIGLAVPEEKLSEKEILLRDQAWNCIKDIIEVEPGIYEPKQRYELIKEACKKAVRVKSLSINT